MLRHAVTALVVIVCAVALTLLFSSRSGRARSVPNDDINDASAAMAQCWDPLMPLSAQLIEVLDDPDRFAQILVPLMNRCNKAEAAIGTALKRHPQDPTLAKLREKLGLSQTWLNDLAKAISAYKRAREQGSAADELAALRALLQ
jgi:hypothetical protein